MTTEQSRSDTGSASLRTILPSPDHRLVFDATQLGEPGRDWRSYGLLLASIYGPPDGVVLEVTVESGPSLPIRWSRTLQVQPGWNLVRLDLATIGDTADLRTVRSVSWRAPRITSPVTLYFDDLLLVDNAHALVEATADADGLYVLTRGQRIVVGATGRFELAFADGQIVAWRDPTSDNLADMGGLGPWPVPLPEDWTSRADAPVVYDDPALFARWGARVATYQRLVEASPFRVVIEGQWNFLDAPASQPVAVSQPETAPGHTWRYVIYPSGCIHVRVTSRAGPGGWSGPRVGYVVGLSGRCHFQGLRSIAANVHAQAAPFVLASRVLGRAADLLWMWPYDTGLTQQRELVSDDGRRLALLVGDVAAAPQLDTVHCLRIWPPELNEPQDGHAFAVDYQTPVAITPAAGQLRTDVPGDRNRDGYNEADGCYELTPAGNVLRFDFDPQPYLRNEPIFRVYGTADQRCWVFARGRMVRTLGRDSSNNLLIRLGPVVSTSTTVEVHMAPLGGTPH